MKKEESDNNNLLTDIIVIRDDNHHSSGLIIGDAINLGYHVNTIHPDSVTLDQLNLHRLVILSTGNNEEGCANYDMRLSVQRFVENGGKVIIEGGENTYLAFVVHHYPAFASKALKTSGFISHNGGDLVIKSEHVTSNLFISPNFLPNTIRINFMENSDMDICSKDNFAEVFYNSSLFADKGGVIVAPSVTDPQIINYCFNYGAVESKSDAKNLLANSIFNLIGSSVSVANQNEEVPDDFILYQNYPNPFNPVTNLEFGISEWGFVSLKIHDLLGKEIAELVNNNLYPGNYKINFDASNHQSGVYFYTLKAGDYSETKKMFLLK